MWDSNCKMDGCIQNNRWNYMDQIWCDHQKWSKETNLLMFRHTDRLYRFRLVIAVLGRDYSMFPLCCKYLIYILEQVTKTVSTLFSGPVFIHTGIEEKKTEEKGCKRRTSVLLSSSQGHKQYTHTQRGSFYVLEFMLSANRVYTMKAFEPCSVTTLLPYRGNIMNSYAVKSIKLHEECKTQFAV